MKKLLMTLGAGTAIIAPLASTIACGSSSASSRTNLDSVIEIALEANFKPIYTAALDAMVKDDAKVTKDGSLYTYTDGEAVFTFSFIELENGKATDYLDNELVTDGKNAADIITMPNDRVSINQNARLIATVDSTNLLAHFGTDAEAKVAAVKFDSNYFGYPINTESVIQIYNNGTALTDLDSVTPGEIDFMTGTGDTATTFVTQFNNLWQGSTVINSALVGDAAYDLEAVREDYLLEGTDGKWTAPLLTNTDFKGAAESIYDYHEDLYDYSTGDDEFPFRNVTLNVNRDAVIRAGIADGSITHTIDGPWVVNELVARTIAEWVAVDGQVIGDAALATELAKIEAAALPMFEGNQMRHFKGGWVMSVNAQSLDAVSSDIQATKKTAIESFLAAYTHADLAGDHYANGGKIAINGGSSVALDNDFIDTISIEDATSPAETKPKFNLSDLDDAAKTAVADVYSSVIGAVSAQDAMNVNQPSGQGLNIWSAWDADSLSLAKSYADEQDSSTWWTLFEIKVKEALGKMNE